jgi:hypothetical protein
VVHSAAWLNGREELVVFGGHATDPASDVAPLVVGRREGVRWTWTRPLVTGDGPEELWQHGAAWNPEEGVFMVFGGSPSSNELRTLGPTSGEWEWRTIETVGAGPSARDPELVFWHAGSGRLVVWGGSYDDEYVYTVGRNPEGWTWAAEPVTGIPPTAFRQSTVAPEHDGAFVRSSASTALLERPESGWQWTTLEDHAFFAGADDGVVVWVSPANELLSFGGDESTLEVLSLGTPVSGVWRTCH